MLDRRHVLAAVSGIFAVAGSLKLIPQAALARTAHPGMLPLRFESEGVWLAGGLYLPQAAPVGALVLVHGGGSTPRLEGLARTFVQTGFAVLAYDKRGLGGSGGVYDEANNTSPENLELLASDAAAAMRTLRAHPRLPI